MDIIINEELTRCLEKEMDSIQTATKDLEKKQESILIKTKKTISDIIAEMRKKEEIMQDPASIADLAQHLTDKDNPMAGRMLIVKPSLFTALSKDVDIKAQYASGTNAPLTENLLPRIHGFEINQYSALPTAGVTNQKGIFCTPEAILIASRLPATPTNWYGNVATATDEASGLSIQIREWYDGDLGQQKIAMTVLYGVAVGNEKSLGRIIAS
jgi:hypothetical protein